MGVYGNRFMQDFMTGLGQMTRMTKWDFTPEKAFSQKPKEKKKKKSSVQTKKKSTSKEKKSEEPKHKELKSKERVAAAVKEPETIELQEAVLWAEILGEPVSKKRRRRRIEQIYGNQSYARRG